MRLAMPGDATRNWPHFSGSVKNRQITRNDNRPCAIVWVLLSLLSSYPFFYYEGVSSVSRLPILFLQIVMRFWFSSMYKRKFGFGLWVIFIMSLDYFFILNVFLKSRTIYRSGLHRTNCGVKTG